MQLLALHAIARHGDGLAPELQRLLAQRNAMATHPKIVELRSFDAAIPQVAGEPPGRTAIAVHSALSNELSARVAHDRGAGNHPVEPTGRDTCRNT